jgi:hypothetical protein
MRIEYSNGLAVDPAVIQIWDDMNNESGGFYRAFWTDGPDAATGSPVIGYCSPGGSHKTIRAVVSELRRLGHDDPIYRNGRLIS